jgi:predicted Zn-dependent protease
VDELNGLLDEVIALTPQGAQTPWPPLWQMTEAAMELRAHGHIDASTAVLDRVRNRLETHPGAAKHPWTPPHLATVSYLSEQWDEAQQRFTALAEESPDDVNYRGYLGVLAARRDDRREAARISAWLRDLDQPYLYGINTLWRARIAALLGEPDEATALLQAAFEQGLTHYGTGPFYWQSRADVAWLHRDMDLEPLRSHPPFLELARPRG